VLLKHVSPTSFIFSSNRLKHSALNKEYQPVSHGQQIFGVFVINC